MFSTGPGFRTNKKQGVNEIQSWGERDAIDAEDESDIAYGKLYAHGNALFTEQGENLSLQHHAGA